MKLGIEGEVLDRLNLEVRFRSGQNEIVERQKSPDLS
jgi:hypothetical protein